MNPKFSISNIGDRVQVVGYITNVSGGQVAIDFSGKIIQFGRDQFTAGFDWDDVKNLTGKNG